MHELEAAISRFPAWAERVVRLADRDEAFRDMCEELAEAEAALARLRDAGTTAEAARREECEGWIARLVGEMSRALCGTPGSATGRDWG